MGRRLCHHHIHSRLVSTTWFTRLCNGILRTQRATSSIRRRGYSTSKASRTPGSNQCRCQSDYNSRVMSMYDAAADDARAEAHLVGRVVELIQAEVARHQAEFEAEGVAVAAALRRAQVSPSNQLGSLGWAMPIHQGASDRDDFTYWQLSLDGVWFAMGSPVTLTTTGAAIDLLFRQVAPAAKWLDADQLLKGRFIHTVFHPLAVETGGGLVLPLPRTPFLPASAGHYEARSGLGARPWREGLADAVALLVRNVQH